MWDCVRFQEIETVKERFSQERKNHIVTLFLDLFLIDGEAPFDSSLLPSCPSPFLLLFL